MKFPGLEPIFAPALRFALAASIARLFLSAGDEAGAVALTASRARFRELTVAERLDCVDGSVSHAIGSSHFSLGELVAPYADALTTMGHNCHPHRHGMIWRIDDLQ